jgi:RNA polymerase sigma-70 factor (ECF subfamily)
VGDETRAVIEWLGREVLCHEPELRAWLRRTRLARGDLDDIVQETYSRLAALTDVGHIANPRAYLFQTARNVVFEQIRRARVVRLDAVAEFEALETAHAEPSPERIVAARHELARVQALLAALPDRRRRILQMRKIEGLSQQEIARRLGVTENVVENEAARGLRSLVAALTSPDAARPPGTQTEDRHGKSRKRRAN